MEEKDVYEEMVIVVYEEIIIRVNEWRKLKAGNMSLGETLYYEMMTVVKEGRKIIN